MNQGIEKLKENALAVLMLFGTVFSLVLSILFNIWTLLFALLVYILIKSL